MNTYFVTTNGITTHHANSETLEEADFFPLPPKLKNLTGPRAKENKEVVVVYVSEEAEKKLGIKCPKFGQRFPTLTAAAQFMGNKNANTLYQSQRHAGRRENDSYGLYGVEFGFAPAIQKPVEPLRISLGIEQSLPPLP